MSWIVVSLLMYLFSVILYLAIRKAQLNKIPLPAYSLWMFGVPIIGYLLMGIWTKADFSVSIVIFIKILLAAIIFSWLGNVFSQKSILLAPNPGYALIISKSYVVFTSLVAVLLSGL